ncbi:MAG: type II secretion system protein, partial [Planctomycetes bacterium]|nr:type II secretion system protein [Planctomycetota bacterium]
MLELLVVIGIIAILSSILVPALGRARRQVRSLLGASNQKQVVSGVILFSMDNDETYPESVATVGFGSSWNWS